MPFDETAYDFEIEKPEQVELDSQLALLNLRLQSDIPNGDRYDEPPNEDTSAKLASGFGFYAYQGTEREG